MYSRYGSASVAPRAFALGHHHVTQNMGLVGSLGVEHFLGGLERFAARLEIDAQSTDFREQVSHFLANVPSDHLVESGLEQGSARWALPLDHMRRIYTSTVAHRGYTGPAAVVITLDELLRAGGIRDGRFVMSFVTESSKWMNAGFLMRFREGDA